MSEFSAPANNQKYQWLEMAEAISVIGSVGGAVASVVISNAAVAAIPLSVSVMLNLVNRRMLLDSTKQNNLVAIAQVVQEQVTTQTDLEKLTGQLALFEQQTDKKHSEAQASLRLLDEQIQQSNTSFNQAQDINYQALAQLRQDNAVTEAEFQTQLETLIIQLEQLQQQTNQLVQEQNNRLMNEQAKISRTVDALRDIETCTQSIRINPISAAAFFNRGLSYQRLGDRQAAIGDFADAIRINPQYAEAYQSRGLACADLGDKKAAVQDLREAARLFFEIGEIEKYQIARDLSKKFYDLDSPDATDGKDVNKLATASFENVALESLFS